MNRYRQLTSGERYARLCAQKTRMQPSCDRSSTGPTSRVRSAVRCAATRRIVRAGPIDRSALAYDGLRPVETRQIAPQ